jgi:hypothetical protein
LLQGRFVDVRMQDCYNVVKCLQDLACLDATTASLFFECNGFSNLSALLSWPEADMRHARWAAAVVLKDVRPTHFFLLVLIASERRTLIWKRDRPACPVEAGQLPFQNTKKESRHARQSERQSKGGRAASRCEPKQPSWRHECEAECALCLQLVALALPTARVSDWRIAKDSVQAISCLIEGLYLFSKDGKHFLYESSVMGILLILQHLGQNQTYLAIITGATVLWDECHAVINRLSSYEQG